MTCRRLVGASVNARSGGSSVRAPVCHLCPSLLSGPRSVADTSVVVSSDVDQSLKLSKRMPALGRRRAGRDAGPGQSPGLILLCISRPGVSRRLLRPSRRQRPGRPVLPQRRGPAGGRFPGGGGQRLAAGEVARIERRCAAPRSPAARIAGPAARNARTGPCRRTRRTAAGWPARWAGRRAGRRPPTPAAPAAAGRPSVTGSSAIDRKAERNGSTREPSEVVPSGNRIRLSPRASRLRMSSRSRPVEVRRRWMNTLRPSRATVAISGQRVHVLLGDEAGLAAGRRAPGCRARRNGWRHTRSAARRRCGAPARRSPAPSGRSRRHIRHQ